jgi:hypothetical protein
VCSMYDEQVASLQAERDAAKAAAEAAEAAKSTCADAAAQMMFNMEATAQQHEAAMSALKTEHAQEIEYLRRPQ